MSESNTEISSESTTETELDPYTQNLIQEVAAFLQEATPSFRADFGMFLDRTLTSWVTETDEDGSTSFVRYNLLGRDCFRATTEAKRDRIQRKLDAGFEDYVCVDD